MLAIARGGVEERGLRAPLLFSREFRREHPERVRALLRYFTANRSSVAAIGAQTLASARFSRGLASRRGCARRRSSCTASATASSRSAASKLLAARIPDAELAVVPGAGHAYALEAPRESLELAARVARAPAARSRPREEAHVASDR